MFLICIFLVSVFLFNNVRVVYAEEGKMEIREEKKIYTVVDINDDFDDSCVLVVMKKSVGAINKTLSRLSVKIEADKGRDRPGTHLIQKKIRILFCFAAR